MRSRRSMTKEEDKDPKIQTLVLSVSIPCDKCYRQVERVLQTMKDVQYNIDRDKNKVTVLGNVDINQLFKKLGNSTKNVKLWEVDQNKQQNGAKTQDRQNEQESGKDGGGYANEDAAAPKGKMQNHIPKSLKQQTQQSSSRREDHGQLNEDTLIQDQPIKFDKKTLDLATNRFDDDNIIGKGGYGPVYKGTYQGKLIAVKKLSSTSNQGRKEFMSEVKLLAKVQHRNFVKLIGYCLDGMLIVYEYLPNGSLDKFLTDEDKRKELDWQKRDKIIMGIARGLVYLHRDCPLLIVHRDINPKNVLLDGKLNPKIADLGLGKLLPEHESHLYTDTVRGTPGYMALEYVNEQEITVQTDVYSYGVLLHVLITGRKATDRVRSSETKLGSETLLQWVRRKYEEGKIDQIIDQALIKSFDLGQAKRWIDVAIWCTEPESPCRPSMSDVISKLTSAETKNPRCVNSVTKNRSRPSPAVTAYVASPYPSHIPLVPPPKSVSRALKGTAVQHAEYLSLNNLICKMIVLPRQIQVQFHCRGMRSVGEAIK